MSPTHTLEVNDPIGFAEAIAARPPKLKFKQVTDLTLRQFKSSDIRKLLIERMFSPKQSLNTALEGYLARQELLQTSRLRRGLLIKIMIC